MLVIVMLLSNSKNLLAQINNDSPSTGDSLKADSTIAVIPIYLIKQANVKMLERLYLLEINNQQDSTIIMKDKYINEQQKIITDFQKRVSDTNKLNQIINNDLEKQKTKNKIIAYGAGATIIGLIIGIICK